MKTLPNLCMVPVLLLSTAWQKSDRRLPTVPIVIKFACWWQAKNLKEELKLWASVTHMKIRQKLYSTLSSVMRYCQDKIIQRIWLTLITFLKIMAFCFLVSVSCLSISIPKALGLSNLFLQTGSWDVTSHAASQCSCDSHNLETVHRGRTQNNRRVRCLCFCEGERFYQEVSIGTALIITQAMHSDIFIILLGDARPYVMLLSLSYAVNSSMQH